MDNQILDTGDGSHTLVSGRFGLTYHSKFGAVTESAYVYLASAFDYVAGNADHVRVLEAGFGTGLNAFMTWLEADRRCLPVQYLTLELYPVETALAAALNYPQVVGVPARAGDFLLLHECAWAEKTRLSDFFEFEKQNIDFQDFNPDENCFDAIYFDAFAPADQPELWTENVLGPMYRALCPGGVLTTFCAQGAFRRTLKNLGFSVQSLPGVGGKWEITRAVKLEH